jgi:hypothetical protein
MEFAAAKYTELQCRAINLRRAAIDDEEPLELRSYRRQLSELELPLASSPQSSACRPLPPLVLRDIGGRFRPVTGHCPRI